MCWAAATDVGCNPKCTHYINIKTSENACTSNQHYCRDEGGHGAQFLEFRLFGGVMEYELPADCSHSHAFGQWDCVKNVHPHWLS